MGAPRQLLIIPALRALRLNMSADQPVCSGTQASLLEPEPHTANGLRRNPERGRERDGPPALQRERLTDKESGKESHPARPRGTFRWRNDLAAFHLGNQTA